ncbi:MAG: ABC transporter permease [Vicinamibacterales bacterium]
MSKLWQDITHAGRVIARDGTFSATVVLTLGLCIGANAAIFTIVNAVLLRPLPFDGADRLVYVANSYPGAGVAEASNGVPDYYDRKAGVQAFDEVALYRQQGRTVGTAAGADRMDAIESTPSLLRMLGARPLRGRLFSDEDAEPGQNQKVILSYALWQRELGGRDDVVGSDLRLNGVPHVVVGVLPRHFAFLDAGLRLWLPLAFRPEDRADDRRHSNNFQMIARLRPGATVEQAERQIDAINAAQVERSPIRQALVDAGFTTRAMPFQQRLVRDVRRTLYLLWGGVVFVLLIGAVNVTNLTLVRATSRAREFATRQALGAGTWPLMRQLFAESLMLSLLAGGLGLVVGSSVVGAIVANVEDRIPRAFEIGIDVATVAFTVAITLVVGAGVALLPLIDMRRANLAEVMRQEGRAGTSSRGARLLRRALVTAQVAFAFMLLVGAGLLLASFRAILDVNPGFQPGGVLTGRISLPVTSYPENGQVVATIQRMRERVSAVPGVVAAGFSTSAPLTESYSDSVIFAEGYVTAPGESLISPARNVVSRGYFEALRILVRRGRAIDERDTATSPPVIVIDERLANKFWAGQDPIGKRMYQPNSAEELIAPGPTTEWRTVVGVVGDVKQRGLVSTDERLGAYYLPHAQNPARSVALLVRAATDVQSIVPSIRRELAAVDAELPFYSVLTMEERVRESVAGRRTAMLLAVGFGIIALLLATVGIYGVLAYQVTQRTREIGIRMALGSDAGSVFTLILGEGAWLLAAGFAIGLSGAVAMRQVLSGELYGVDAMEPSVIASVAAMLAVVALAACAVPARRAARIDPVVALAE